MHLNIKAWDSTCKPSAAGGGSFKATYVHIQVEDYHSSPSEDLMPSSIHESLQDCSLCSLASHLTAFAPHLSWLGGLLEDHCSTIMRL
jgi:hypothetical protein